MPNPPPIPEAFRDALRDPASRPAAEGRAELPRGVWKELKPLGHEVRLWQGAITLLRGRLGKARLPAAVAEFVNHWLPKDAPAPLPAHFYLVLGLEGEDVQLRAASLPWVNDASWTALLRLPALREAWAADIRASHLQHLHKLLPGAWLMEPAPLPPGAVIPRLEIASWSELEDLLAQGRSFHIQGAQETFQAVAGSIRAAAESRSAVLVEDLPVTGWLLAGYTQEAGEIALAEVFVAGEGAIKLAVA